MLHRFTTVFLALHLIPALTVSIHSQEINKPKVIAVDAEPAENPLATWIKKVFIEVERLTDVVDSKKTSLQKSEATVSASKSLAKFTTPLKVSFETTVLDVAQGNGQKIIVATRPGFLLEIDAIIASYYRQKIGTSEEIRFVTTSAIARTLEPDDVIKVSGTIRLTTPTETSRRNPTPPGFPFFSMTAFDNWHQFWFTPISTTKVAKPVDVDAEK